MSGFYGKANVPKYNLSVFSAVIIPPGYYYIMRKDNLLKDKSS